jgi:hypothetical protein
MSVMTEPTKKRPGMTSLGIYLPDSLVEAFDRYVTAVRPRTSKTAVIEQLLEVLLAEKGFYQPEGDVTPPPQQKEIKTRRKRE